MDLEHRILSLEKRLAEIEQKFNKTSVQNSYTSDEVNPEVDNTISQQNNTPEISQVKTGNWLAISAIICFIFAAGFIIKLSIESGWLTPSRQIGIAALLGIILIIIGLKIKNIYLDYASYLPASGIIILYCSVFAAERLYHLTNENLSLLLIAGTSCVSIWLYLKFKHDIYVIAATVGSYIAPLVLSLDTVSTFTIIYFLCCSVTFAIISIGVSSRLTAMVAGYLAIIATSLIGLDLNSDGLIVAALAGHFIIFAAGIYGYSIYNVKELTLVEAWSILPVLIIFYSAEYYFIAQADPGLAPWISLFFAGVLLCLYFLTKTWLLKSALNSQAMIFAYISMVLFHSLYIELLPDSLKPWLFSAILITLAGFILSNKVTSFGKQYYLPSVLLLIVLVIEYINILMIIFGKNSGAAFSLCFVAYCSMCLVFFSMKKTKMMVDYSVVYLALPHVLAISALYQLAYLDSSLLVSVLWLLYAGLIMGVSTYSQDKNLAKSALLVLGFAAGKALLYDAASTPSIVRIGCLLLTGGVLYGAGFIMKKIEGWS